MMKAKRIMLIVLVASLFLGIFSPASALNKKELVDAEQEEEAREEAASDPFAAKKLADEARQRLFEKEEREVLESENKRLKEELTAQEETQKTTVFIAVIVAFAAGTVFCILIFRKKEYEQEPEDYTFGRVDKK